MKNSSSKLTKEQIEFLEGHPSINNDMWGKATVDALKKVAKEEDKKKK